MLLSLAGLFERWLRQIIVSEAYLYSIAVRVTQTALFGWACSYPELFYLVTRKYLLLRHILAKAFQW